MFSILFLKKIFYIKYLYYLILYYLKPKTLKNFARVISLFKNEIIFEIGGPSRFFKKNIPIYQVAAKIAGVNFSEKTTWEENIKAGNTYNYFANKYGEQFICEASNLRLNKKYNVILSSNCLEYIANPIRAISNWLDHLNDDGVLFLVLPKKESNFDWRRPNTGFDHVLKDYKNNIEEDDLTHLDEIIKLHDFNKDVGLANKNEKINIFKENLKYRQIHHHIFNLELLFEIGKYFGCQSVFSGSVKKINLLFYEKYQKKFDD